jgi:glycosyltransferase involved in cell wall biosynthesis
MKVLLYSHAFAPKIGGVETYVMLLARGLAERGVEVTVATPTPSNGFDDSSLPFRVVRRPRLRTLWRLLGKADIVHLAGPAFIPLALGLLRGKPVVVEHHGYQAVCPNGLLFYEPTKSVCPGHFMRRRYWHCLRCNAVGVGWGKSVLKLLSTFPRRWLCFLVAANPAVSHHVLQRLQLPQSQVIYHGIPVKPPLSLPQDFPLTFAYLGRLVSEKGLPLLLEATKRLKEEGFRFRLLFVGDGPERKRLEAMVREWSLQEYVTFTGFLQGKRLEEVMASVNAVIMPSIWEETAGLAAMEHMMRGRPVIAADIGGLGEVVDGAGLKFPPGDAEALTDCLRRILQHPQILVELGQKARQRALQLFRWERMVDEHLCLYWRLLNASRVNRLSGAAKG